MTSLAPSGVLNRSTWALAMPTSSGATDVTCPARVGAAKMRKRTSFFLPLPLPLPLPFALSTVLYSDICPWNNTSLYALYEEADRLSCGDGWSCA